jgi:GntR family transcriptional regulator, transcriptional repressor for pyruvate dehydrogenase complex
MAGKEMFETVRNEKAPHRIIGQIRLAILDGKLKPGDKLPNEQELLAHFGVSRHTLREALRALEILGLLEIRAGSNGGAFVTEVDLETAQDNLINFFRFKNLSIAHVSEIRKILETHAARVAVKTMTEQDLEKLREIQELSRKAVRKKDFPELIRQGILFHRAIAQSTDNPILVLLVDFVENLLTDIKKVLQPGLDFSKKVLEGHQLILEALEQRDETKAMEEMFRDVSAVEDSLIQMAKHQSTLKWT